MKKGILITIFLLFTKTIFADGIIPNLQEYLQSYPDRIDGLGWVTIPSSDLLGNDIKFDTSCQYQLIFNKTTFAFPTILSKWDFTFKSSSCNRLMRILHENKIQVWQCVDGDINNRKDVSKNLVVEAFKQLSPESVTYVHEKRLQESLRAITITSTLELKTDT